MLKFISRGLVVKLGSQTLSRIRAVVPHYDRIMCVFYMGTKDIENKDIWLWL